MGRFFLAFSLRSQDRLAKRIVVPAAVQAEVTAARESRARTDMPPSHEGGPGVEENASGLARQRNAEIEEPSQEKQGHISC